MNIQKLERDYREAHARAVGLLERTSDQASAEQRAMTATERAAIEDAKREVQNHKARLERATSDASMMDAIEQATGGWAAQPLIAAGRSIGAQFVRSVGEDVRRRKKMGGAQWATEVIEIPDPRGFGMLAATITEDPTAGGIAVPPQYVPGIVSVRLRPPVVADLLGGGPTTSNAITYNRETAYTNAAAAVAEGAPKPESAIVFEPVTDPVVKLAHWIPASDELLEDGPGMMTYINTRLMQGLQVVEDDQLLNGSGVAPNMLGLLNRTGLAADVPRGTDTNADAIAKQIAAIQTATKLVPTGVVVNPTNALAMRLLKDTTGRYIGELPFTQPLAVTTAIAAGTALVVCGTAAVVFRRGGINVQASNAHADYFVRNLTAIRAEERLALAVMIPAAFGKVTGLA
jgi:HK97 family phage major capsid protein